MDDWQEGERKRQVLRTVGAYRELCRHVRKTSTSGLLFGGFMFAIWYMAYGQANDYGPLSLIYLGLVGLEFTVALWKRVAPSAEGVFFDGLVLLAFGAANLTRIAIAAQNGRQLPQSSVMISLGFGAYWMWQGFSTVRTYGRLRRSFADRPTADQMRWFDGLLADVRRADPTADPTALDLATRPPLRGKLLGDTAIFLQGGSHEVFVLGRDGVEIVRTPDGAAAALLIHGEQYGAFPLDPDNWRNYAAWKADGGSAPVPDVHPARPTP